MNAIVAVSENWGIGKDNALLFHIRADLQRFKALTTGHTVVMGRRTLESLPGGRGLPGRRNLVLSTRPDFAAERAEVVRSLDEAVAAAEEDAFVIGGETVYRALLARCERVFVSKVFAAADADAFFPDLDAAPGWAVEESGPVQAENGVRCQSGTYRRVGESTTRDAGKDGAGQLRLFRSGRRRRRPLQRYVGISGAVFLRFGRARRPRPTGSYR